MAKSDILLEASVGGLKAGLAVIGPTLLWSAPFRRNSFDVNLLRRVWVRLANRVFSGRPHSSLLAKHTSNCDSAFICMSDCIH